jgi:hypothetical protein
MASDLSPWLGNKICRWLIGNAMPTAPTALYLALFDGNPKTTGVEKSTVVNAGGRQAITFGTIASGVDHILASSADVDYGNSAGACSLSHLGVFDASAGGNLISSRAIAGGAKTIEVGTGVKFLAGNLTFNIGSDT